MIKLNRITKKYKNTYILRDVTYEFLDNTIYAIVGESGSGKTTLLNILGVVDLDYEGTYKIDNVVVNKATANRVRNHLISYVYQKPIMFNYLSVYENINLPHILNCNELLVSEVEHKVVAMNIKAKLDKKVTSFSGGECQRLSFIRGELSHKKILLLDEATSALDEDNRNRIENELEYIKKKSIVIFVTHDLELARSADVIIEIKDGCILEQKNELKIRNKIQLKENKKLNTYSVVKMASKMLLSNKKKTITFATMISGGLVGLAISLSLCQGFLNYFEDMITEDVNKNIYVIYHQDESMISNEEINEFKDKHKLDFVVACDVASGVVCDTDTGKIYLNFFDENNKPISFEFRYNKNSNTQYRISEELYDKLGDVKHLYLNNLKGSKTIVVSEDMIIGNKGNIIEANNLDLLELLYLNLGSFSYIVYSEKPLRFNYKSIYKIVYPYEGYYKPIESIISGIKTGIVVFSLISVIISLMGIITITLLDTLERRKQIGLLELQGWSVFDISRVLIFEMLVKGVLVLISTIATTYIGITNMNKVFIELLGDTSLQARFDLKFVSLLVLIVMAMMVIVLIFPLRIIYKSDVSKNLRT